LFVIIFFPFCCGKGVGRNKSSLLTQLMDLDGAGGDYHTSYWPQPSFLSSRGFHFEMTMQTYSEISLVNLFFFGTNGVTKIAKKY
jgi:hypothetical protein